MTPLTHTGAVNRSLRFSTEGSCAAFFQRVYPFISMRENMQNKRGKKKRFKHAQRAEEMSAVNGLIGLVNTSNQTVIGVMKKPVQ